MDRLRSLGLTQPRLSSFSSLPDLPDALCNNAIGRIVFESHAHCVVACDDADVAAQIHPRIRDRAERIVVGDWVVVDRSTDPVWVVHRLPRDGTIARRDPDRRVQVLCANVDVALLATALDRDLNPRRLERYLAVAAEAEIAVAVILTKVDLDPSAVDEAIRSFGARLDRAGIVTVGVVPVSAPTGVGVDKVLDLLPSGTTGALLGSSGVGKSTLVNALAGTALATGDVRDSDHRGRHTTTSRRLVPLPSGGWLVDNPGLRQVGPTSLGAVSAVFDEVTALAERCRFRDCTHDNEPGCAILAAIDSGELDPERLEAWDKLQREVAYEMRRIDRRAAAEERARWKRIHLDQRERQRLRDRD